LTTHPHTKFPYTEKAVALVSIPNNNKEVQRPKYPYKKAGRDFLQVHGVIGQGVTALNCKTVDLD